MKSKDQEHDDDTTTYNAAKTGTSKTEEDAMYADLGFMFEGSHASTLKHFEYERTKGTGKNKPIRIALEVVDDEPGGVQSGHYL